MAGQLSGIECGGFPHALGTVADADGVLPGKSLLCVGIKDPRAGSYAPAVEWLRRPDRAGVVLSLPIHLVSRAQRHGTVSPVNAKRRLSKNEMNGHAIKSWSSTRCMELSNELASPASPSLLIFYSLPSPSAISGELFFGGYFG